MTQEKYTYSGPKCQRPVEEEGWCPDFARHVEEQNPAWGMLDICHSCRFWHNIQKRPLDKDGGKR